MKVSINTNFNILIKLFSWTIQNKILKNLRESKFYIWLYFNQNDSVLKKRGMKLFKTFWLNVVIWTIVSQD